MVKIGLKEAAIGAVGDVVRLKDGSTQCVDDIEIVELPEASMLRFTTLKSLISILTLFLIMMFWFIMIVKRLIRLIIG